MKKLFLCCVLLLGITGLCLAQTPEEKPFEEKQTALFQKISEAIAQQTYPQAESYFQQMIANLNSLPHDQQAMYAYQKQHVYYNMACVQSIQGKRKAAIRSFEQAYTCGYDDYRHVLNDADLNNIREDKKFKEIYAAMKQTSDFLSILQDAPSYVRNKQPTDSSPHFRYQAPNDRDLVRVRSYFNLDSVAGAGDELSKIKNLLTFVHNTILHDGNHENPSTLNAIDLAEACKDGSRGLNCRGLATVLNECYLAMGFKSRFVTCMPQKYINDCHVINAVYSTTLDKWVWVDPTNNAWVTDENGLLLSIQEVRERLRDGRPLQLNEEANWNNRSKQTKEEYLENYMAKNLYCIVCSDRSEFNTETHHEGKIYPKYTYLCPEGFMPDYPMSEPDYIISNDAWFWQSPYNK